VLCEKVITSVIGFVRAKKVITRQNSIDNQNTEIFMRQSEAAKKPIFVLYGHDFRQHVLVLLGT
jgi:hypothetical protein